MDRELLHTAWDLAETTFRPQATDADRGGVAGPVADNVRRLGEAGLFGLGIGRGYGGLGADAATRHEYGEILASACGVTAFTQQQLQTGIKFLVECGSTGLKRALLPGIAAGRRRCGIAMSHLRRSGPPSLRAERVADGYRMNGVIPWITGWGLLDGFVLGAACEDGDHLFAYVEKEPNQTAFRASEPLDLIVMAGSDTVEVQVEGLFVPDERVLRRQPSETLRQMDRASLTTHAALPLGCARAAIRCLRELAQAPGREGIADTAFALTMEADRCRRDVLTWNCDCVGHRDYETHALRARATAHVLSLRAAGAAVAAMGGRAHLVTSVPQRLLREAQFYFTAVQTPEVQAATLDGLVSPYFGQ